MPAQSFLEQAKASYRELGVQNEEALNDEREHEKGQQPSSSGRETHAQQQQQQQKRRRRRRQQAGAGTGIPLTLLALGAGGYCLWRWWRRRRESGGHPHPAATQGKSSRSAFSFDRGSKKGNQKKGGQDALSSQSSVQAVPTVKKTPPPPNLSGPGPRVSGNPKKKNKGKNAKKEKKAAASQGGKDDAAAAIIAERAKQKGIAEAGKTPETGFYTTVDVEKNTDAYHNVKQWQETGKKTYKR